MAVPDDLPVALLGPPGTIRDLIGALLTLQGFALKGFAPDGPGRAPDGGEAPAAVIVAVTPGPDQWDLVRRWGSGILLVAETSLSDDEVLDAVLQGVDAVVTTDTSPLELRRAVEAVGRGETLLGPTQARRLACAARSGVPVSQRLPLTSREVAILRSIEQGESVKQTARSLGITTKTVENLQSRLFRKLEARNRAHAIVRARSLGLLEAAPAGTGPTGACRP